MTLLELANLERCACALLDGTNGIAQLCHLRARVFDGITGVAQLCHHLCPLMMHCLAIPFTLSNTPAAALSAIPAHSPRAHSTHYLAVFPSLLIFQSGDGVRSPAQPPPISSPTGPGAGGGGGGGRRLQQSNAATTQRAPLAPAGAHFGGLGRITRARSTPAAGGRQDTGVECPPTFSRPPTFSTPAAIHRLLYYYYIYFYTTQYSGSVDLDFRVGRALAPSHDVYEGRRLKLLHYYTLLLSF